MNALKQLQTRWASLEARERRLVAVCAALVALAMSGARRLPHWVRRLVPASFRARVRAQLGGRRVG